MDETSQVRDLLRDAFEHSETPSTSARLTAAVMTSGAVSQLDTYGKRLVMAWLAGYEEAYFAARRWPKAERTWNVDP